MQEFVTVIAFVAMVATALMVLAMLYLVWLSANDERHRPNGGDGDVA